LKTTIETSQVIALITDKIREALAGKGYFVRNNMKAVGVDEAGNFEFYLSLFKETEDRLSSEKEFLKRLEANK